MKLASLLGWEGRRPPTISVPATSRAVHAVPFQARRPDTPPPEPTSPPPPSPDHASLRRLALEAYRPQFMVPSSSGEAPDFEGTPNPTPARVLRTAPSPCSIDKFIPGTMGKEVRNGPPSPDSPAIQSRSPPPSPSHHHPPAGLVGLHLPALPPPLVDAGTGANDEDDGVEEAESDHGDSSDSEFSWEGRTHMVDVWLPPGRYEVLDRLLYAYIDPPIPVADVNAFLRAALATVEPNMPVEFLPSSRGAMLFRCGTIADRDLLRGYSPIHHQGIQLSLQRPDECSNRFYRVPPWLAFVHVDDFPDEHRDEAKIKEAFRGFCEVAEVDPACITENNFGPLRLLLEVNVRLEIPYYVRVSARRGRGRFGGIARVSPIRIWRRDAQLDSDGNLTPFFRNAPPPPPPGPLLGPAPPFWRDQQRLPP